MKRILDIDSFIREGEQIFLDTIDSDTKVKIKHKKNDHPITVWLKNSVNSLLETNSDSISKKINLRTNKKLNKREIYTLKKSALDFITSNIFKKVNKDFFSNNFIIKLTQDTAPEDFPIKIKKNQIVYIYFNFYPLALIKLNKNSKILEPISGNNYVVEEYYQNSLRNTYFSPIDDSNFSLEFPLFFGYIVLKKGA